MKNLALLFLVVVALGACKKSKPAPTIVGTWKIENISGTTAYKGTGTYAELITTTYSYNSPVLMVEDSLGSVATTVNNEEWAFNNDGTFSIYENFQADTATVPTINTITGWWDYTSSTVINSDLLLRSLASPSIVPAGGTFFIVSVSNTQLVLNVNETTSSSIAATNNKNLTLTFAKQ